MKQLKININISIVYSIKYIEAIFNWSNLNQNLHEMMNPSIIYYNFVENVWDTHFRFG